MGICDCNRDKDSPVPLGDNFSIPVNMITKASKSICKITIIKEENCIYGTGFFMKVSNYQKYLITNCHVINESNINDDIEIEIYNQNTMILNLNNRKVICYSKLEDITMIEIKTNDYIYKDILFLDYDINYKRGYQIYKNASIFLIGHSNGENANYSRGKIINIYDFEFNHNIATEKGASGSPIIFYNNNINDIQVIGIHKEYDKNKKLNIGTFIAKIFKKNNNNIPKKNN